MTIQPGDRMPDGTLLRMGEGGPEQVAARDLFADKRVVLFGLPGAYTGTCSTAHVPSFVRTKPQFDAKGIDAVVCLSGNDPFVLKAWGAETGATAAGIDMVGDPSGDFIVALGMELTAPAVGFHRRSKRFAALVEDGVVKVVHEEPSPGQCDVSGGEAMLAEV